MAAAAPGRLDLPGLTVIALRGVGAQSDDLPLGDGLWLASRARALVENAVASRRVEGRPARTLSEAELGDWIDQIVAVEGRPSVRPGSWKVAANRAGSTEFVAPDLVVGTLVLAWDRRQELVTPASGRSSCCSPWPRSTRLPTGTAASPGWP